MLVNHAYDTLKSSLSKLLLEDLIAILIYSTDQFIWLPMTENRKHSFLFDCHSEYFHYHCRY